jgi:tetraacyldisaccharide-1-P 4'-kinase
LQKAFPDHHRYTQSDVDSLIDEAKRAGANSLITTAKDAVKLSSLSFSLPCYVQEIEPQIENADELIRLIKSVLR